MPNELPNHIAAQRLSSTKRWSQFPPWLIFDVRRLRTRMLKAEEITIERGRAVGGDFIRITHLPTGISRSKAPPLGSGRAVHEFRRQALEQIETEIRERGLLQYLVTIPTRRDDG